MNYANRWLTLFIITTVMLMVDYFYDIKPNVSLLFELKDQAALLIEKINSAKKITPVSLHSSRKMPIPSSKPQDGQVALLSSVSSLAAIHGLVIDKINFKNTMPFRSFNAIQLSLNARGNFQQMSSFIFALTQPDQLRWIHRFLLQINKDNTLSLDSDIFMIPLHHPLFTFTANFLNKNKITHLDNPFCENNGGLEKTELSVNELTSVPLSQVKLIGTFKKDNQPKGLVLIPSGEIVSLTVGSTLGKGVIEAIYSDHIVVATRTGKNQKKISIPF